MNTAANTITLALPTDKIIANQNGSVAEIIFNNPQRHNAVSLEMWDAVEMALHQFADNQEIRVLILSGAGGKSFVSGADISKFEKERGSVEAVENYNTRIKGVYDRIEHFPKPTIARISGHCIGGGLNLATCCDLRFCSRKSKFSMPAAKLALGYPFDAIRRLIAAVGPGNAKRLMFTAKAIDATEAYRIGYVQQVAESDELDQIVDEVASNIAQNAPLTINAMKYIATQVLEPDPASRDLEQCAKLVSTCFASKDYVEGRTAFMEKRTADFKGE